MCKTTYRPIHSSWHCGNLLGKHQNQKVKLKFLTYKSHRDSCSVVKVIIIIFRDADMHKQSSYYKEKETFFFDIKYVLHVLRAINTQIVT